MVGLVGDLVEDGRYADADKLQRQVLEAHTRTFGPDTRVTASDTYNLACIAARAGNRDEALKFLGEAIDHGLSPGIDLGIEQDTDLASLHGDPRFDALVAHAKERAASSKK